TPTWRPISRETSVRCRASSTETSSRCCTRRRQVACSRLAWLAFSPAVFPESSSFTASPYVTRACLCYIGCRRTDERLPNFPFAVQAAGDQDRLRRARGGREGGPSLPRPAQIRQPLRRYSRGSAR